MDSCNISEESRPQVVTHLYYAYLGTLLVLGLLLNGLALWVFCCRLRTWTETRVYMTNLAAADLCLLCALPFMLQSLSRQSATDTLFCQLSQGVYLANRYMSISLIMAIAVDRYLAVRHPLRARRLRSPRQAVAVCAALWLLVSGSLLARWALAMDGSFCFGGSATFSPSTVVFSLLGFYPPLAVLAFCSLQVVGSLAQRPVADVGQQETTRKARRMVWANLAVFVVCFLPLHVVLTVRVATGSSSYPLRYATLVTSRLSDANCCLDAICYYFMAQEFREASAQPAAPRSQDTLGMSLA
ncbi:G-protein coupled receptor 35 [Tamandua tetradactyla]|uniref:G-protein coupled receptor 35 n=1 Tax=Tamandua tetradactyla TaxID=48850 RepID=UPI00405422DC